MEHVDYLGALRRGWKLLVIGGVLGVIVGAVLSAVLTSGGSDGPLDVSKGGWEATANAGVPPDPNSSAKVSPATQSVVFYAFSDKVLKQTAKRMHIDATPEQVKDSLSYMVDKSGATVDLTGQARTKADAVKLVNSFAASVSAVVKSAHDQAVQAAKAKVDSIRDQITALGGQLGGGRLRNAPSGVRTQAASLVASYKDAEQHYVALQASEPPAGYFALLSPATESTAEPVSNLLTNPFLDAGIGLVVGLLLAAGLALLLAQIDQRIRSRAVVETAFGAPVLVEVPRQRLTGKARDIVVASAAASAAAEAYRVLRTVLTYGVAAELPWTVRQSFSERSGNGAGAPSAQIEPGEGDAASPAGNPSSPAVAAEPSTLTTMRTRGRRTARSRRSSHRSRVIVVTAATDERIRPTSVANLAASYAEANQDVIVVRTDAGLPRDEAAFSEGTLAGPQDAVRPSALPRVATLDLAALRDAGVVNGRSEADLIADIVPLADIVLIEAAPVLEAHDVGVLSTIADDVLIVAEYGHTTRGAAEKCAEMLARMGTTPRGVVFTQVPARRGPIRFRRSGGARAFRWGAIGAARPN